MFQEFGPLSNDLQVEAARQANNRARDLGGVRVVLHVMYKGTVDLQRRNRETSELA